jgi:hypothetical protein
MEQSRRRPPMKATSETMRAWAEALSREMESWPGIALKKAFGMTLVYRNGVVFAGLPGTRALYMEDAILLKFIKESPALKKQIAAEKCFSAVAWDATSTDTTQKKRKGESRKWRIFLMSSDADFHRALDWLAVCYRCATLVKS